MIQWIKTWARWRLAGADLEELHQRRLIGQIYRQWFGPHEFPEVATVLANMETEVLGREPLDACWPPGPTGPWTVDRLRDVVRTIARSKDDDMRARYLDQLTELQQLRQRATGGPVREGAAAGSPEGSEVLREWWPESAGASLEPSGVMAVQEPGAVLRVVDPVADLLDELADLAAAWKRWRDQDKNPPTVRRAMLMVVAELAKSTSVDVPPQTDTSRAQMLHRAWAHVDAATAQAQRDAGHG